RTWATSCIHTRHSYAQTFGLGRERDREVTTAQQDSRRVAHPRTPGLAGPTAVGANIAAGGRRRWKPCRGRMAAGNQRQRHHRARLRASDRPVAEQPPRGAGRGIAPAGGRQAAYGVIWITARTEIDKEHGLVDLEEIAIPKVSFPGAPASAQERYLRGARTYLPTGVKTVPLEQFEASVAAAGGVKAQGQPVKNDPPRIIVSPVPALLVRIDGTPSLRQGRGPRA